MVNARKVNRKAVAFSTTCPDASVFRRRKNIFVIGADGFLGRATGRAIPPPQLVPVR
jgi:hypothetical protein